MAACAPVHPDRSRLCAPSRRINCGGCADLSGSYHESLWLEDEQVLEVSGVRSPALADACTKPFRVPVAKVRPISERMDDVGPDECVEAVSVSATP